MRNSLPTSEDRDSLDAMARGFQISAMLRVIADLSVADKIAPDVYVGITELAGSCSVLAQPLLRVLRALASVGVFTVSADGGIGHTPKSFLLRADAPGTLLHTARFWADTGSWIAWEKLDVAMRGAVPHDAAWGMGRFAYLRSHADEARVFDLAMAHFPGNRHAAFAAAYDFSDSQLIIDIGGGNGTTLHHILQRFPKLRGIVFDRDDVVLAIKPDFLADGRLKTQSGSFFDGIPKGADTYMIVAVLHDWPDEDCVKILANCRASMETGTKLLVGERILEPDPLKGPSFSYMVDVQMMAMFGSARERTLKEFQTLFDATGFGVSRTIATSAQNSIIEVVAVQQ